MARSASHQNVSSIIPLFQSIEMDLETNPTVTDFRVVQKAIVQGIRSRLGG